MNIPESELQARIEKFQAKLAEKNIGGALLVQAADLYYFSGTAQSAHLYIPAQGEPMLMVRKSLNRAQQESQLKNIVPLKSLKNIPVMLAEAGYELPKVLGLELDVVPANQYLFYRDIFSGCELTDASRLIRDIRQIKSPYELELLRVSGINHDIVFREIPGMIYEGITELELAARIEGRARSLGHMGYLRMRVFNSEIFFGHILCGASGAVPSAFDGPLGGTGLGPVHPLGAGRKKIEKGEPLVVDYTGIWDGYIVDQTRTFSMGPLPDKMLSAFELSLKIQAAVVERLEPGVNASDLHELALTMAKDAGLDGNFMGSGSDQVKFLGHGVGLELDELPVIAKGLNTILQPNMVFAIEPKFVFPGLGAVGIENTFIMNESGVEKITITPDDLVIV